MPGPGLVFRHLMTDLAHRREAILRIAANYGASNIRVVGPGPDGADDDSGLDFLVDIEPDRSLFDLVELGHELEDLLGVPVEVLSAASLNPRLRASVLADAREI
jgi:uncharacterized protein